MLHARIRTPNDAFHFIAEVNPYNLQMLRQHVRQTLREDGDLRIAVEIDPADQPVFARYTARWLPQLVEAGLVVEVAVSPSAGAPPAEGAVSVSSPATPELARP